MVDILAEPLGWLEHANFSKIRTDLHSRNNGLINIFALLCEEVNLYHVKTGGGA